jgi:multidrug efflux pump subunit AcrA (membrane-fusion protein)
MTVDDLRQLPIEVGLQTETGFPHKGRLDYAAVTPQPVDRHASGAWRAAQFRSRVAAGFFVRVRVPDRSGAERAVRAGRGARQRQAGRYLLVVNGENVVEQRKVRTGPLQDGGLRVIEEGLKADDRVITAGLLRAIPGQKVDPQLRKIEAQPAAAK